MSDNVKSLSKTEKSHLEQDPPPTAVGWTIRGISLFLVLGFIGYFVLQAFQPEVPPVFSFTIKKDKIAQRGDRWVVPIDILNEGSKTAVNLKFTTALTTPADSDIGKNARQRSIVITRLGPNEAIFAEFWFAEDPRGFNIHPFVESYVIP